jgi:hypothetical protein
LWTAPASAADLTKIDRRIAREPTYRTKTPKYCLVVFGAEAKTRVWFVRDGNELYVDRNGNGDLTEPGNRLTATSKGAWLKYSVGEIAGPGGTTWNLDVSLRRRPEEDQRIIFVLDRERRQYVGFDDEAPFHWADRPADAPIIHVDGPLEFRLYGDPPRFVPGQTTILDVAIGTPGVGKGSFAAIQCCTVLNCRVSPAFEIAFPTNGTTRQPIVVSGIIGDD